MTTPRLGFSFLYFAPRLGELHQRWFSRLAHHGYAGAELPVVAATDAELRSMRRALDDEGLGATAVGFATAEDNPIDADPAIRRAAVEHLAQLAEKAALLGAEVLAGPIHSAYGRFTEAPPTADERARCIDVLRAAGERAAACGVRLAVEPLNRFECYFLNTAAACDALVRAVGHPAVCGALDTHHAHIEENDIAAAIAASRGTLGHVQLSENHRGTPGTGQVDFARVFAALRGIDYRGWLVIEAFSRQDPAFGSALRIWRELDGGPEQVLAAGAALVRGWETAKNESAIDDKQTITIVLIDDQAIVRAAFKSLLERNQHFRVIGDAGDARSGIHLVQKLKPDVVVLDITMPGLSGIDAVVPLKKAVPSTRVLMASQHEDMKFVQQALQAGADGYLTKDSEPEELALAIESVWRGDSYLSPKVANGLMSRAVRREMHAGESTTLGALTPREREVFQLLALGKANKEVAAMLGLSLGTVKKHRENLQRKLDCHSAAELARTAIREGLLNV